MPVLMDLGKPRYIGRFEEGHLSSSADTERHVRRRPCPFSPRRDRGEEKAGRNSHHAEEDRA